MPNIIEPQKELFITGDYDVVVAGGGVAGIAAALAAARQGKNVLLIERMFTLGGLATLGLITIFLPLCDGKGQQVCFGIAEELLKLSIRHGYEADYPKTWLERDEKHDSERYFVRYNAQAFAIMAEQLLNKNNVTILYGTTVCNAIVKNSRIKHLIIENKSGRSAISAKTIVDTTGDADVCALAGEITKQYGKGNAIAAWYYETINGRNELRILGVSDVPPEGEVPKLIESERISGLDSKEISKMMIASHKNTLESFLANGGISQEHSLSSIATIPQLRMTRRIVGCKTLEENNCDNLSDSIGMIGDWRRRGPVYEIPFGSLYGRKIENLITAGRCISVSDGMWDVTRVIPACALTGEAAGIAASISDNFKNLDIAELQMKLKSQRVKLHQFE